MSSDRSLLRPLSVAPLAVAIAFLTLLVLQMDKLATDPGLGWHLKTGEVIWTTGSIPRVDPFLAGPSRPWVCDQWLADLIFHSIFLLGSWPLLYLFATFLFISPFLVLLPNLMSRSGASAIATTFVALCALKLSTLHFVLRPLLFSFPMLALVLRAVWRARSHLRTGEAVPRSLWLLPPLFAVWANLHPSFPLGLALLAGCIFCELADPFLFDRPRPPERQLRVFCLIFLLCLAATFVNPFGVALHQSILSLGGSQYFMTLHNEWRGLDLASPAGSLLLLLGAIAGFILLVTGGRTLGWGSFELVLLLSVGCALRSARLMPYAAILSAAPLAQLLTTIRSAGFWRHVPPNSRLRDVASRLEEREQSGYSLPALAGVGFFALLTWYLATGRVLFQSGELGPPSKLFPTAAVDAVLEGASQAPPRTVLNTTDWSGYITWRGFPHLKPVVDDRNVLLGEGFYRSFFEIASLGGDLEGYLQAHDVDLMILHADSALARVLRREGRYRVLHSDSLAVVFATR